MTNRYVDKFQGLSYRGFKYLFYDTLFETLCIFKALENGKYLYHNML